MSKGGSRRTLLKGGLPSGVPQENGGSYMYNEEHYLQFFSILHMTITKFRMKRKGASRCTPFWISYCIGTYTTILLNIYIMYSLTGRVV